MAAPELVPREDLEAVATAARDRILTAAHAALERHQRFTLCLDGGHPTQRLLSLLVDAPLDWSRTHLYLGDERRVSPSDSRCNRALVERLLTSRLAVRPALHGPDGANPDGDAAAEDYAARWRNEIGEDGVDLLLLGMGPDGHTASLFPHSPALAERSRLVLHVPAPTTAEPRVDRLTLSPVPLMQARALILFGVGEEKRAALARLLSSEGSEADTPARLIRRHPRPTVLADRAALG